jgi:hypothetical protein
MHRFWREQVDARVTARGIALSLPLMYPDGLQVQLHLEPVSATCAIVSDRGQTLARLHESGLSLDARETAALLDDRKKVFDLEQHGFELRKQVRLPLDGLDIQMVGESLVSIPHLIYKFEPATREEGPAERQLRQIFQAHNLAPTWNTTIDGQVEKGIRVDTLFTGIKPLACKVVKRRGPMLAYMEQWGWRWLDVQAQNPLVLRAMVYDPDRQEWDETPKGIAHRVCDFFCPYFETQTINAAIDRALAAGNWVSERFAAQRITPYFGGRSARTMSAETDRSLRERQPGAGGLTWKPSATCLTVSRRTLDSGAPVAP